jgi:hypothetical protein
METLQKVAVNRTEGVHGDFRGSARPGKPSRRQISLIEAESWAAAMAELGREGEGAIPWFGALTCLSRACVCRVSPGW